MSHELIDGSTTFGTDESLGKANQRRRSGQRSEKVSRIGGLSQGDCELVASRKGKK